MLRGGMVGAEVVQPHADYAFGHDLLKAAKAYAGERRRVRGRRAPPTAPPTIHLPRSQREADIVISIWRRADHQLHEAVHGVRTAVSRCGIRLRTPLSRGARAGNVTGIWPLVWVRRCRRQAEIHRCVHENYGKPPEPGGATTCDEARHAGDERAQDDRLGKIAEHLEKGAKFDVLKTRTLPQLGSPVDAEMYTISFKPAAEVKDKWDLFTLSAPVPGASQSLEVIAPTKEENNCTMPA